MGRRAVLGTVLATAVCITVISTMGWALPYPFSSIGPTVPHLMRSELVREIAERQRPRCLLVVGNSRAAFGVNARQLSQPDCAASNIGFAGLGAYELYDLAKAEADAGGVRSMLLFVTDEYLFSGRIGSVPSTRPDFDLGLAWREPQTGLLHLEAVRRSRINQYRFNTMFETLMGRPLATSVFRWNAALGRWIWPANETLELDKRTDRHYIIDAVSKEYYEGAEVGSREHLAAYIERMRGLAGKLSIVFPPQHSSFAASSEQMRPGVQRQILEMLSDVAAEAGVGFVDCSKSSDCGLSDTVFSDPVHLNAAGAVQFTEFLKTQHLH